MLNALLCSKNLRTYKLIRVHSFHMVMIEKAYQNERKLTSDGNEINNTNYRYQHNLRTINSTPNFTYCHHCCLPQTPEELILIFSNANEQNKSEHKRLYLLLVTATYRQIFKRSDIAYIIREFEHITRQKKLKINKFENIYNSVSSVLLFYNLNYIMYMNIWLSHYRILTDD